MAGGRLEYPINWEKVDELLTAGCTGGEIAAHFGIHPETLYDRTAKKYNKPFSEYSYEMRQKGDSLLRQAQFDKALGRNKDADNTMMVWLGKNRLKQSDQPLENMIQNQIEDKFNKIMEHINKNQSDLSAAETNINKDK